MDLPRFSRAELACIIGVPAAWAILLLFHPLGEDFYPLITDNLAAWQAVHIGMALFIPLFAGAVFLLLRGIAGAPATVSRIALVAYAVLYAVYEISLGIGTGILTVQVDALSGTEQAVGAGLVESYADSGVIFVFLILGSLALIVAMCAAALALRRAYDLGWLPPALLVVASPLIMYHEPPLGPLGLAFFIAAVVLLVRQQAASPARIPAPVGEPRQA
jgi:hypothetical protein